MRPSDGVVMIWHTASGADPVGVRVEVVVIDTRGQESGVQIALGDDAAGTDVPALGQRLFDDRAALLTGLAEPCGCGREFGHRSASVCSFAFQV
jgi:hypothetical protein